MSYYGSFVLQCYVLRMRVMMSTVGGNLTNRPPALRHIHVNNNNVAELNIFAVENVLANCLYFLIAYVGFNFAM